MTHAGHTVLCTARDELSADVVDLSMGGICLFVRGVVRKGEFVRIRAPFSGLESVELHAVVVRAHPTELPDHTVVGLSFLALPEAVVSRLAASVAR